MHYGGDCNVGYPGKSRLAHYPVLRLYLIDNLAVACPFLSFAETMICAR